MTEDTYVATGGYDDMGLEVYAKPPAEVDNDEPKKSWEELVSAWMTVRELGDASNWTLGDIAVEFERAFGRAKGPDGRRPIDVWAAAIGEKHDTVRQYAWVSRTFPRRQDRMTGLSWTHYRTVVKTGDAAMTWINEAVANNWTAARLAEEIKNVQDAASVTEGRPCDQRGEPLPEEGSIHIRANVEDMGGGTNYGLLDVVDDREANRLRTIVPGLEALERDRDRGAGSRHNAGACVASGRNRTRMVGKHP